MLICGIKLSHDGCVALIDDGKLVFSVEVEKTENNYRYSPLGRLERVAEVLRGEDIDPGDVDRFVIDGWRSEGEKDSARIRLTADGSPVALEVAPYADAESGLDCLTRFTNTTSAFGWGEVRYSSYHHATGHILACYCCSPFARRAEDALVLVWDGGMAPQLYEVRYENLGVRRIGQLLPVIGNTFATFSYHFEPFRVAMSDWSSDRIQRYHLSIAGKAMAYAALGRVEDQLFDYFENFSNSLTGISVKDGDILAEQVKTEVDANFPGLSSADVIATLQAYLGRALLGSLRAAVSRLGVAGTVNLGISGGCGLNIKWNRLLRNSGLFREVWVPPFTNDSGAAIGAAAAEMFIEGQRGCLDWDIYQGPGLAGQVDMPAGWTARACTEQQLARLLHEEGEPVVVLSGRSELGPRALGNRSILAPATDPAMKDRLNALKGREDYRPIAPVCLRSRASEIFDPGEDDPYMLFEHDVRPEWRSVIPAVVHVDGTARLQTVSPETAVIGPILTEYANLTGVPVLCNTSANLSGRGFFPDVGSAASWGKTRYIWSDGRLLVKEA